MTVASTYAGVDPEIAAALAALPVDLGAALSALSDEAIVMIRDAVAQMPVPDLSNRVERVDHEVPGSEGVIVRVHRPAGVNGPLPGVFWIHGGGLVLGTRAMNDLRFDLWCTDLGCVGASVEYRLAPEAKYPAAIDDCYAGLAWLHANADALGVDASRIGIGGESAGGGLAAALGLLARDRGEPPVAFQLLIYPMIDDRQTTESSQWPDPIWPPNANSYGWTSYLGTAKGTADVPIYAAAARATDLAGLPPTLISVGAIDGFSDEDIDYAVRLRHAGVPVELHVYPGAPHGFDAFAPETATARRANHDMTDWLRQQLTR